MAELAVLGRFAQRARTAIAEVLRGVVDREILVWFGAAYTVCPSFPARALSLVIIGDIACFCV